MTAIVEARHLQKTYGKIRAVDDVSFEIKSGEIIGLLDQKSFLNPYLDLGALIVFSLILFFVINATFKRRLREQY